MDTPRRFMEENTLYDDDKEKCVNGKRKFSYRLLLIVENSKANYLKVFLTLHAC